tara:strand:- start:5200 stop:6609 length:1410 start_codon:yes stop_codon:yes gene_type:complete
VTETDKKYIFVVGDVMLDTYLSGTVGRISPEAPIPVLSHEETIYKLGGAANVANNLVHSDINVRLFGLIGNDKNGEILSELVKEFDAQTELIRVTDSITVNKLRISSQNQQIARVDFEKHFKEADSKKITGKVLKQLSECSLLILSDYGKGTLLDIETLIKNAKNLGIPVLIDPKGNNFDKYRDATVLKPNKKEFETIVGQCVDSENIMIKGEALRARLNLNALLVTLSEDGMVLFEENSEPCFVPVVKSEIVDVTGAGDTVIAWLARGIVSGMSILESAIRANLASSVAVTKLGATPVSLAELIKAENSLKDQSSAINLEDFLSFCKSKNEVIIFTNGCFDILHEGHVNYLQEAKKLGGKLIVGVNDDASVKRIKGKTRPINKLESRIKVLEALSSVDFVIPFAEETPLKLIKKINPDILVKGGDYSNKKVVGSKHVEDNGGKVVLVDFLEGFSTTNLIEAAQEPNQK